MKESQGQYILKTGRRKKICDYFNDILYICYPFDL